MTMMMMMTTMTTKTMMTVMVVVVKMGRIELGMEMAPVRGRRRRDGRLQFFVGRRPSICHGVLRTFWKTSSLLLALTLLGGLASAPGAQEVSPSSRSAIRDRGKAVLTNLVTTMGLPGGSAALVLRDGSIVTIPFGMADKEAGVGMTEKHLLLSGSAGKTYVSAAMHHLMLAGKLSFDDKAVDYFEGEDWFLRIPNADKVTIGNLMRHESGIPRYVFKREFFATCLAEPDKVWKPEELLAYVFDDDPIHAAGNGWAYSDTNYIIVGMILEKVAGKTFYEYVAEHFLEPNGLEETVPLDRREIPGLTQGYCVLTKQFGMPDRSSRTASSSTTRSSSGRAAGTRARRATWRSGPGCSTAARPSGGEYLDVMLDAVPARMGPGKEYGYGVTVLETEELGVQIGHDGFMTGFQATMNYYPQLRTSVAVLLNTDDGRGVGQPLDAVARELAAIVEEVL